jgi:hypothetical protein
MRYLLLAFAFALAPTAHAQTEQRLPPPNRDSASTPTPIPVVRRAEPTLAEQRAEAERIVAAAHTTQYFSIDDNFEHTRAVIHHIDSGLICSQGNLQITVNAPDERLIPLGDDIVCASNTDGIRVTLKLTRDRHPPPLNARLDREVTEVLHHYPLARAIDASGWADGIRPEVLRNRVSAALVSPGSDHTFVRVSLLDVGEWQLTTIYEAANTRLSDEINYGFAGLSWLFNVGSIKVAGDEIRRVLIH